MNMQVPNSLKWGDGMLLFSFMHVLTGRAINDGGTEASGSYHSEGRNSFTDFNYHGSPGAMMRAQSVDSNISGSSSHDTADKYALIFKGIVAWVNTSRAFSYLRLSVLPVLRSSVKSSLNTTRDSPRSSDSMDDAFGDSDGGIGNSFGHSARTPIANFSDLGGLQTSANDIAATFNIHPEARYVNNTAGDLFTVLIVALEATRMYTQVKTLLNFMTIGTTFSNLYAAAIAVYPPLGSYFILNEDNMSFKRFVTCCLQYSSQDSKAIIPALYLLAGIAGGSEDALETVYRFLDHGTGTGRGNNGDGNGMNVGNIRNTLYTSNPCHLGINIQRQYPM